MSLLLKWLDKSKTSAPSTEQCILESLLPDPNLECTPEKSKTIQAANTEVLEVIKSSGKRKRGEYSHYDSEQRAKIGRWACENGNASAVKHFSKSMGKPINESTVRSLKKQYLREVNRTPEKRITSLEKGKVGRPLLLGQYDSEVMSYIKKLRSTGAIVNRRIVIAGAKGIIQQRAPSLLRENGGHVVLDKAWADSFLRRAGFVRRKGTKAARKLPMDFMEQKTEFIESVTEIISENKIPPELVINFDQTNISIIPCGDWTLQEQGTVCLQYGYDISLRSGPLLFTFHMSRDVRK